MIVPNGLFAEWSAVTIKEVIIRDANTRRGRAVIGLPFNDRRYLGGITEVVAELLENGDCVIADLATQYPSVDALVTWIRTLPVRGPDEAPLSRVRLRIPAPDPSCVERAGLYIAVAELLDPKPVRLLATLETPIGMHTFAMERGTPIVLFRSCIDCRGQLPRN